MSKPVFGLLAGLAVLAAAPTVLFAASKKKGGSRATASDLEKVMQDAVRHVTGREPHDVIIRSPEGAERWTDQPVPEDAVLFVIHDGGDLSLYGDPAPRRQVQKALGRHGYRLMEDSHVYSFVVPI